VQQTLDVEKGREAAGDPGCLDLDASIISLSNPVPDVCHFFGIGGINDSIFPGLTILRLRSWRSLASLLGACRDCASACRRCGCRLILNATAVNGCALLARTRSCSPCDGAAHHLSIRRRCPTDLCCFGLAVCRLLGLRDHTFGRNSAKLSVTCLQNFAGKPT
jgi:hypothetical protein